MNNKEPEVNEIEIISLQPFQELRFIMKIGNVATVELTDGTACSFGWNLPMHTTIKFRDQSYAITSLTGCGLKVGGSFVSCYSTKFEEFQIINDLRQAPQPPTLFVVGAPSVGKTSICKWICNTVLNEGRGRVPIYVNADPDQAPFCPQGCVGAIPIVNPIDNLGFPFTDPLIYFYGATKLEENRVPLFKGQFEELMTHIVERRKFVGPMLDGGVVIDFPSITNKANLGMLEKFLTDLHEGPAKLLGEIRVLVVGDDRLYNSIRRMAPFINTLKMPMVPGTMTLSKEARNSIRSNETRRYFYGDDNPLLPTTYLLSKHDKTCLYSLGNLTVLSHELMPIQMETPDPKVAHPVPLGERLAGCILAIVPSENRSVLWKQTVKGFLHVIGIETENQLNVLKPNDDPLPSNTLIVSQVKCVINN